MKIESFIPGRVRLRSALFKDDECADMISRSLMSVASVKSTRVNRLSGGMLLEYDQRAIPNERLIAAAPMFSRLDAVEAAPPEERLPALQEILRDIMDAIGHPSHS